MKRAGRRGYTIVELMMALVIFGIGVIGLFALQKATSSANRHSKNLAIATHVAQTWLDQLAIDSTRWTQLAPVTSTTWLGSVLGATNGVWTMPAQADLLRVGPGFDALGAFVDLSSEDAANRVVFCAHVRLTRLFNTPGNELVRTEVRVFWPRQDRSYGEDPYCALGMDQASINGIGLDTDLFHFVYKTSAVRQTPGFGG